MCWITFGTPIKKVADKDIQVYKILEKHDGKLTSVFYEDFEWTVGKEMTSEMDEPSSVSLFHEVNRNIKKGLHSLMVKPYLQTNELSCFDFGRSTLYVRWRYNRRNLYSSVNGCLYKAVIPEGSEYYVNEYGEAVSNRLKLIKEIETAC